MSREEVADYKTIAEKTKIIDDLIAFLRRPPEYIHYIKTEEREKVDYSMVYLENIKFLEAFMGGGTGLSEELENMVKAEITSINNEVRELKSKWLLETQQPEVASE